MSRDVANRAVFVSGAASVRERASKLPGGRLSVRLLDQHPRSALGDAGEHGAVDGVTSGDDAGTVLDRLRGAAVDSNTGKGKKKVTLHTLLDIFAFLKPKWGKARDVKILTKEPVRIIYVSPEDDAKFIGG